MNLDNAVELCREYKLKDGGYIFVSYEDGYYSIKREEDGIVLDLFDNDDQVVEELGYLMISAGDFEEYL